MCHFAQIGYICRHSTNGPVWTFCAGADTGECQGIRQEEGLNKDVLYNCPACGKQPPEPSNTRRPAVSRSSDSETFARQSSISGQSRSPSAREEGVSYHSIRGDFEQRGTSRYSTDRDRNTSRPLISRGDYNIEERSPSMYNSFRSDSYYLEDSSEEREMPTSQGEYDIEERSPSMYSSFRSDNYYREDDSEQQEPPPPPYSRYRSESRGSANLHGGVVRSQARPRICEGGFNIEERSPAMYESSPRSSYSRGSSRY